MECPIKGNEDKCKKYGKCLFGIFLTVLGVAVALKVIVIILNILPGPSHGNVLIVISCRSNCSCSC